MTPSTDFSGPLAAGVKLEFLRSKAPELARDIVCELDAASSLAASYGLSPSQWEALRNSSGFRNLVIEAKREISGPQGVTERIRRKAALILDQGGLLDMGAILSDPSAAATARVAAFSELKEVAGITREANKGLQGGVAAPGPLIVINLPGADPVSVGALIEHVKEPAS